MSADFQVATNITSILETVQYKLLCTYTFINLILRELSSVLEIFLFPEVHFVECLRGVVDEVEIVDDVEAMGGVEVLGGVAVDLVENVKIIMK